MADEVATTDAPETEQTTTAETEEQRVPYERFQQANKKAKEAADRAKALEGELQKIREDLADRDEKGLPELDQMKRRLESAEKRAQEAEQRATETESKATRMQRERLVTQAASKQNFIDPDDAARYIDLDDIEDADAAERAVKRVAKAKKHLIKLDEPVIPGQVLQNGQRTTTTDRSGSNIDLSAEAQALSQALQQFASQE
jgi:hypothetical protein